VRARSLSHAGITVSSFNRAVQFYWDVFGCPLVGVADTPSDRVRSFFGIDAPAPSCKIGWIRVPGGGVLEIFEFQPQLAAERIPWNRVGLTHLCFDVRGIHRWHAYLKGKGVEVLGAPEQSPRGHWFFFIRDLRRQPHRADRSRLHVPCREVLGPLGAGCSAGDVSQVLRGRVGR
jgi:catechol 2,3-dioxygenase-like lactoylglutathione lyase family enzyme